MQINLECSCTQCANEARQGSWALNRGVLLHQRTPSGIPLARTYAVKATHVFQYPCTNIQTQVLNAKCFLISPSPPALPRPKQGKGEMGVFFLLDGG